MTETEQAQRNRDLVRALYEASFAGDANAFSDAMLEDSGPCASRAALGRGPAWTRGVPDRRAASVGGGHRLRQHAPGQHFGRWRARRRLLTARSAGGDELWLAEHWIVRDEKLWRLRVFYHDTRPLEGPRKATGS